MIATSSWNLLPLPPLWSLETRGWGTREEPSSIMQTAPRWLGPESLGGAAAVPGDDPRGGLVGAESRLRRRRGWGWIWDGVWPGREVSAEGQGSVRSARASGEGLRVWV